MKRSIKLIPNHAIQPQAETLLRNLRGLCATRVHTEKRSELSPLFGLSRAELQTLAEAVVAPERQHRLRELLEKNQCEPLPREDSVTLERLLDEVDQVAFNEYRNRTLIGLM